MGSAFETTTTGKPRFELDFNNCGKPEGRKVTNQDHLLFSRLLQKSNDEKGIINCGRTSELVIFHRYGLGFFDDSIKMF